jgi:magnesium transporter
MEDQILHAPKADTLDKIFSLKRSLLRIRRIMTPQREVFYKLSHSEISVIPAEERFFFRSVYDHYVLLNDLTESLRELLASALEIYLSASNNRMNKVVQILTVITTMFMPLTFITGFFGMNFFQLEFSMFTTLGKIGLAVALICLLTVPTSMFFWIRRRFWS